MSAQSLEADLSDDDPILPFFRPSRSINAQSQETELSDEDPIVTSTRRSRSTILPTSSTSAHAEEFSDIFQSEQEDGSFLDQQNIDESGNDEEDGRSNNESHNDDEDSEISEDETKETTWSAFPNLLARIETPRNIVLHYPRSLPTNYRSPITSLNEQDVLEQLLDSDHNDGRSDRQSDDEHPHFEQFCLTDFVIYSDVQNKDLLGQMQSLHIVATERDNIQLNFYVDGYLQHEGRRYYVERARIREISVGCLEEKVKIPSVKDYIYVQTAACHEIGRGSTEHVWYQLLKPAEEYTDIYHRFLWLADFLKHFTDFLELKTRAGEDVELADFREQFLHTLQRRHVGCNIFQQWHGRCDFTKDFQKHVVRHAAFLWNQVGSLGLADHELNVWYQVYGLNRTDSAVIYEQTVVTENVRNAFIRSFPEWGRRKYDLFRVVMPSQGVQEYRLRRMREWSFPEKYGDSGANPGEGIPLSVEMLEKTGLAKHKQKFKIEDVVGSVAIIRRNDLPESDSAFQCSYAFVRESKMNKKQLACTVVWLKHPGQTMCGMRYPIGNELFVSDECSCGPVPLSHVMSVYSVSMLTDHARDGAMFFAREKYISADQSFVTAKASDLVCACQRNKDTSGTDDQQDQTVLGDQEVPPMELRNLSLFAGAGILDCGLGAEAIIKTRYAVDLSAVSMKTHAVNTPHECTHVVDSVNTVFKRFMQDSSSEFDMVSGGTPCQGFSGLNNCRSNKSSQRKCSLLASAVSFVERFLPLYVLLENVPQMDQGDPNACEVVVCCLVALGYQVRKTLRKACESGAPQKRKRLFIVATGSGLKPPQALTICEDFESLGDAISHLEPVKNDTIVNIKCPDHIPVERLKWKQFLTKGRRSSKLFVSSLAVVQEIPRTPTGRTLYHAYEGQLLSERHRRWVESMGDERRRPGSKTLGRVDPGKPIGTVVTKMMPLCARAGRVLHPTQDRVLSLEEFKIAQGIPQDFVLIGTLNQQMQQVGNGVAYPVAVALGRSIGKSWRDWLKDHPEETAALVKEREKKTFVETHLDQVTRSTSAMSMHEDEAQSLTDPQYSPATTSKYRQSKTPAPIFDSDSNSDSSSSDATSEQLNNELMTGLPLDRQHRLQKRRQVSESVESEDKLVPPRPSPPTKRLKGSMQSTAGGGSRSGYNAGSSNRAQ